MPLRVHATAGAAGALLYDRFILLKIRTRNPLFGKEDYNCHYSWNDHEVLGISTFS